ncbi:MAG TPA: hypothetical protein VMT87_03375 [Vicinamibacteria bacterium]|nr:hypothetical protein [Vicinamibacteria bacterium]
MQQDTGTTGTMGRDADTETSRLPAMVGPQARRFVPTLRRAVGHLSGTPLPGEEGNVVLAGPRDTFFRALKDIRDSDQLGPDARAPPARRLHGRRPC